MEDRVLAIPVICSVGGESCGLYAVLDGHEGEDAAQFVTEELPGAIADRLQQLARRGDGSSDAAVEAAVRDALAATNARFLQRAAVEGLRDGTTAVFVLLCGRQYLIGSIGDSFAILCSRRRSLNSTAAEEPRTLSADSRLPAPVSTSDSATVPSQRRPDRLEAHLGQPNGENRAIHGHILSALHSPGREDERRRIDASGGFVRDTADGRPRLQGELTLSRALGDLPYRKLGLIATPEFSGWHTLTRDDEFLILASDGLLDTVSAQEACDSAAALAAGRRLPLKPPWSSSAIALGPAAGGSDVPSSEEDAALQRARHQCGTRPGIVACLDCCPGCVTEQPPKPATLPQAIADVLQEAAYNRTSLDNISVVVIDLRGDEAKKKAASVGTITGQAACNASATAEAHPQPGSIVAAARSPQAYELLEQLSSAPLQQQQMAAHRLSGRSGTPASASHLPAAEAVDLHAVAQRWLEADGGDGDIRGFCAAQIHPLSLLQLGPAETALIESLAGLPMMLEEAAPEPAGFCTRRRGGGPRKRHGSSDDNSSGGRGGSFRQTLEDWNLQDSFAKGHFGEVWHGVRRPRRGRTSAADAPAGQHYVLKRLLVEHGMEARLSGLREAYFGQLLLDTAEPSRTCAPAAGRKCIGAPAAMITAGAEHIVRFVESFETRDHALWLVFHNEGRSLHTLMYGKGFAAGGPEAAEPEPAEASAAAGGAAAGDVDAGAVLANGQAPAAGSESVVAAAAAAAAVARISSRASSSLLPGLTGWLAGGNAPGADQQASAEQSPQQERQPPPPPSSSSLQRAGEAAAVGSAARGQLVSQTEWWWALRRDRQGDEVMREVLRQMLAGLAAVHAHNVTHRDLKPENLLLSEPVAGKLGGAAATPSATREQAASIGGSTATSDRSTADTTFGAAAGSQQQPEPQLQGMPHVRLIDFGSAVDQHSFESLYGADGPSEDEQTPEYAPPEATFGTYWHSSSALKRTWPYDMWSSGVVWLEMLLGTPHVFQVGTRTQALLEHKLRLSNLSEEDAAAALLLRGLMELCIFPPQPSDPRSRSGSNAAGHDAGAQQAGTTNSRPATDASARSLQQFLQKVQPGGSGSTEGRGGGGGGFEHDTSQQLPMPWSCTDAAILQMLAQRSPAKRGPPSILAVRLLRRLLHWNPAARPLAHAALRHAYFTLPLEQQQQPPYNCTRLGTDGEAYPMGWC